MIHAKKKDGSIEKVARSSIKYIGGQEDFFKGEGDGQDFGKYENVHSGFFQEVFYKIGIDLKDNCFLDIFML